MLSRRSFLSLTSLILALAPSSGHALLCRDVHRSEQLLWERIEREIRPPDEKVEYENDLSYLREHKRSSSLGLMQSRFDARFQTRFYFAATASPRRNGEMPLVDPLAKGVYIFLHGSGTMKSSGRNFSGLMNTLGQMGYSAIGFDLPFHMEGPRMHSMNDAKVFMRWMDGIMTEIRTQAGDKPIYLVGHSFGPDVMAEYAMRHPRAVQGMALLSPAGFDRVLSEWYDRHTSKMKFGGDVPENSMAGQWAATVSNQFQWNKTEGRMDPTRANPDLRVRVLSGDREEYVPAPLGPNGLPSGPNTYDIGRAIRKHLSGAEVTIHPGTGHYLFDVKDSQGRNVVLREALALDGVDAKNLNDIVKATNQARQKSFLDQIAFNHATDRIFQTWVNQVYTESAFRKAVDRGDERFLRMVETRYAEAKFERESRIRQRILATADQDPAFYQKYKKIIDEMRSGKKKDDTSLFSVFAEYLEAKGMTE